MSKKPNEDYNNWKKSYLISQKSKSFSKLKPFLLATFIVFSIAAVLYYWNTGELQFLGKETDYAKAKIVNVKVYTTTPGYFMESATYEFKVDNKTYSGKFDVGKKVGLREEGEYVKVKYSTANPEQSIFIAVYKSK